MSYPILITPEAEEDIRSAAVWYESKREGLGREFVGRVDRVLGVSVNIPKFTA
jgi:hypothetical protein